LEQLAIAHELQGDAAATARDLDKMLAAYKRAEPVRRRMAVLRNTPDMHKAHAQVLHALGLTKKFAKQLDGAAAALREAATLRLTLEGDDNHFRAAESLQQLALVQSATSAVASKRSMLEARKILRKLTKAHPRNRTYRGSLAKTDKVLKLFR
ncbi:MAG: hypothetical protein AAFV29_25445, partial [Myxococcota bacterium]